MDDGVIVDEYSGETAKYFLPRQSIVRFSDACFSTSKKIEIIMIITMARETYYSHFAS